MVASTKGKKEVAKKKQVSTSAKKDEEKKIPVKNLKNSLESPHKEIPDNYVDDLGSLAKVLESNPAIVESVREVLDYHLLDPIDRKTFPRVVNAMSMLLGSRVATVIILACHLNTPAFFDDLHHATKNNEKLHGAIGLIQHLTSIYGDRIQLAYTLSTGSVDEDWNLLDINTYKREGEEPVWFIDMKISLYNGTETKIKMVPNSAFQLIGILMKELVEKVPNNQVDLELIENYKDIISNFNSLYYYEEGKEKNNHPAGYA